MIAIGQALLRGLAASCVALASLSASAPRPSSNWDRVWWEMDDPAFFRAYPSANWPDQSWEAIVPAANISRSSLLARNIERGTTVRFQFGHDGSYKLETVRFVVAGNYDRVAALLERQLGPPVAGDRTETHCFNSAGERKIEDPSGVGHIIASCLAEATFVDRRHGNVVYLESVFDWQLERHSSRSKLGSAQLVTIEALEHCGVCTKPK